MALRRCDNKTATEGNVLQPCDNKTATEGNVLQPCDNKTATEGSHYICATTKPQRKETCYNPATTKPQRKEAITSVRQQNRHGRKPLHLRDNKTATEGNVLQPCDNKTATEGSHYIGATTKPQRKEAITSVRQQNRKEKKDVTRYAGK